LVNLWLRSLILTAFSLLSKSLFEEAERKLAGKRRKMLWRLFFYFVVAVPSIYLSWLSTMFTWVDVYGIPATKPCHIKTHSTKRERRRTTNYGTALIYYFLVVFGENILLTLYFYFLRQELVRSREQVLTFNEVWWTFALTWVLKVVGFCLGVLYYFCICKIDTPNCQLNQPVIILRAMQKIKRIDSRI